MTAVEAITPYALFRAEVVRTRRLTPHLRRITFGGPELAGIASAGLDQRIKLFFPLPGQDEPIVPRGENWYPAYRALDEHERPFMRTYTIRYFRPAERELDVDVVLHGDSGPGSAWAGRATAGDRVAILAPDARHTPILGYEYQPPAGTGWVLLAGDDTALPAITAIVEALPAGQRALVFVEVDSLAEMMPMDTAADVALTWLSRDGTPAAGAAGEAGPLRAAIARATFPDGPPYAWLAGESSVITDLRRHLVRERGVDKKRIYFSGYWSSGGPIE